jgi:hypothetical protein
MNVALRAAAAVLALPLLMMASCGTPAAPQSPSLKLPEPVVDLAAVRSGNEEVRLTWTMPKRTTDKVILKGDQDAHLCRRVETGPCETAADLRLVPDAPAHFVDHLPAAHTSGPPKLMTYSVELRNHAGHNAGPSNPAYTAAGAAPPRVEYLSAAAQAEGVLLRWQPVSGEVLLRIHRELVTKPGAPKRSETSGSPIPPPVSQEQTLEVTGNDQGRALDRDAALGHTWRYTVQRVEKLTIGGHAFEIMSTPSDSVTIDARDTFPPRTPEGLEAIADPEAHAIDLAWAPNTEPDLAGYIVYRRDTASNAPVVRISPPGEVAPSFRDANVRFGHRYAYSISAVDRDGNESPRSAETEESLPQQ